MKYASVLEKTLITFLFLAVLTSVVFRFTLVIQGNFWLTDGARDFLVARNIWSYGDNANLVPYAAYAGNSLANSLFYYRFISWFGVFGSDYSSYQFTFSFIFCLILLFSALIFSRVVTSNKLMQWFFVTFIFVFNHLFWTSIIFFQPNFAFIFLFLAITALVSALIKISIRLLLLGVVAYLFSVHLHHAALVLLPWLLYVIFYFFHKKKKILWPIFILLFGLGLMLLNQIFVQEDNSVYNKILFFSRELIVGERSELNQFAKNFFDNMSLFIGTNFIDIIFNLFLLVLTLVFLCTTKYEKLRLSGIILITSYFALFIFIDHRYVQSYYFVPLYFVLFIFSLLLFTFIKNKLVFILFGLILFVLCVAQTIFVNEEYKYVAHRNESIKRNVAFISSDSFSKRLDGNFYLQVIDTNINEANHFYYMYLEEIFNKRLVANRHDHAKSVYINLLPILDKTRNIYLICDHPSVISADSLRKDWCLDYFTQYKLMDDFSVVFKEDNFAIYHILLKEKWSSYNYLHKLSTFLKQEYEQ